MRKLIRRIVRKLVEPRTRKSDPQKTDTETLIQKTADQNGDLPEKDRARALDLIQKTKGKMKLAIIIVLPSLMLVGCLGLTQEQQDRLDKLAERAEYYRAKWEETEKAIGEYQDRIEDAYEKLTNSETAEATADGLKIISDMNAELDTLKEVGKKAREDWEATNQEIADIKAEGGSGTLAWVIVGLTVGANSLPPVWRPLGKAAIAIVKAIASYNSTPGAGPTARRRPPDPPPNP